MAGNIRAVSSCAARALAEGFGTRDERLGALSTSGTGMRRSARSNKDLLSKGPSQKRCGEEKERRACHPHPHHEIRTRRVPESYQRGRPNKFVREHPGRCSFRQECRQCRNRIRSGHPSSAVAAETGSSVSGYTGVLCDQ